jgi:CDP-paratose 2-epimerase
MRILITGGSGFVGANLAVRFKQDSPKDEIVCLDNLSRRGSALNLPRLKENRIKFILGDIRNTRDIKKAGSFDLMLECSAEPSVLAGYQSSPEYVVQTNLVGSLNCLEAVRKNKSDIIFLSTSRVYPIALLAGLRLNICGSRFALAPAQKFKGVSLKGISEEFGLAGQRSLYGATKLCSELVLQEYTSLYKMRGLINRCGVIAGPWQMGRVDQGFVALWVARHIFGGRLAYIGYQGQGLQVRDVLHIDDLYNLLRLQIRKLSVCNGQVYNVGGGRKINVSLRELTALCQRLTGNKIVIKAVKEDRALDVPYYITDYSKANREFGWVPQKGMEQIVADIAEWIYQNKVKLKHILT